MTLTPRPVFWEVVTRAGRLLDCGSVQAGAALPRQHEQVVHGDATFTVGLVRWYLGNPLHCRIEVAPVGAMFDQEARR